MSELNAWILNVGLSQSQLAITQYHYAEEELEDRMTARLYWPEAFSATVIDDAGQPRVIQAYAHHPQSQKDYRSILEYHRRTGVLRRSRAKAIELWACRAGDLLQATGSLAQRGCTVFSADGWDALLSGKYRKIETRRSPALVGT